MPSDGTHPTWRRQRSAATARDPSGALGGAFIAIAAARRARFPAAPDARRVQHAGRLVVDLPVPGASSSYPRPEQLAYYAETGLLGALEVLDWPMAVVTLAGQAVATQQHNRAIGELGDALPES